MLLTAVMADCKKEDEIGARPQVTSTNPINNATSIPVDSKISATFNVAMEPATITKFTLLQGTTPVSGDVVYSGTTATFTPAANLNPKTFFTAIITASAKDLNGNSLLKDHRWNFTTGSILDITLPIVRLTDPDTSATEVALNQLITATFSEPMDRTSITPLTFTLKQGTTFVSGEVTTSGRKATFTPASNLEPNKIYVATITTGAKDMAGNAIANRHISAFTTVGGPDVVLPKVISTDPFNNLFGVARDKIIAINFEEEMDPQTINASTFILNQGIIPVPGTVAYSGTRATFTPTSVLAAGTLYTATIFGGATDLSGTALAAKTVWSFTTE